MAFDTRVAFCELGLFARKQLWAISTLHLKKHFGLSRFPWRIASKKRRSDSAWSSRAKFSFGASHSNEDQSVMIFEKHHQNLMRVWKFDFDFNSLLECHLTAHIVCQFRMFHVQGCRSISIKKVVTDLQNHFIFKSGGSGRFSAAPFNAAFGRRFGREAKWVCAREGGAQIPQTG